MKPMFISFLCLILLSASTCIKDGDDCHSSISIKNNSSIEIVAAIRIKNADGNCRLDGKKIEVNDSYKYYPFIGCIENSLKGNNPTLEVYIVDPEKYNSPNAYYDCDSIEIKNTVLKHYVLTLDDLIRSDFTITYP